MNMPALIIVWLVLLLCWAVWSRTRLRRAHARLRRLYARQALTASLQPPAQATPEVTEQPFDDRQMNLFTDIPHLPVASGAPRSVQPLRRRAEGRAAERLDWQYFNKDCGDLAYPEAKDRRRPATADPDVARLAPRRRA